MNKHALIPLVIGLVVGLGALKIGYDHLNKIKNRGGQGMGPTQTIVVSTKEIPLGTKLSDKDLTVVSMPVKLVPEGAVTDAKEVIGQTLKTTLTPKMPVLKRMVGPGEGLEGVIPPGYRAVAVKVDEFTSVGGLLSPGTKVDVLATFTIRKASGGTETVSKLVLQNVEVRAVGQQYRPDDNTSNADPSKLKLSRSVTLLVKTDQSEALQLAASMGSIRLALRSALDDKSASTKGITLSQLVPLDGTKVDSAEMGTFGELASARGKRGNLTQQNANDPYRVEIMNGDKVEHVYFASADSDKRVEAQQANVKAGQDVIEPMGQHEPPQVQAE